jgi:hypothetical protein
MSDSARVNGNLIGWDSLKFKINSSPYTGITAIEYGDAMEIAPQYGMGRSHAPRGTTAGKYSAKPFVLTCSTATARAIRADLANQAGRRGLSYPRVPIDLQYAEEDDGPTIHVEGHEARLVENEGSHDEGPDGLTEKLTFQPRRLLRDGQALYDTSEEPE